MALEIRPNCECCDKDLPPDAKDAMICTYECTFCRDCVERILANVCPNCGGGFEKRPIRPNMARREGVSLKFQPVSTTLYSHDGLQEFSRQVLSILPQSC